MSNCRYGIDRVTDIDPPSFPSSSVPTPSKGPLFSAFWDGFSINASSPASNDDFRGGGVRVAPSEVLFIADCEPCELEVLGNEEESGLLLCDCVDGLVVPLLSELVGVLEGGGLVIGNFGGATDGSGEILSRFKGDGTGLEKFGAAPVAIAGSKRR